MKIVKLKAENVKRLSAVEITPDGSTVLIGGKNEAGKSSVLDAIAMALGGAKLAPPQPIRKGQNEAVIEVDLGDYVVTRRFKRVFKEVGSDQPDVPTDEYTSTLAVTSKPKGDEPAAKFASPQAMLDKLLGSLSFDPLTFATAHATDQAAILRRVVKLDTSDLDQAITDLEAKQTEANRELKEANAAAKNNYWHDDAPTARISAADLTGELEEGQRLKDLVTFHQRNLDQFKRDHAANIKSRESYAGQLAEARKKVEQLEATVAQYDKDIEASERQVTLSSEQLASAQANAPNMDDIKARVAQVEDLNRKFEANRKFVDDAERIKAATRVRDSIVANLNAARGAREARVAQAKFPVEGLAFGDAGVLYNGIPFAQASTAAKLRVSVAVGLALNPALKVLLIREGAFLDADNLALVGQLAEEAGAQIWIERVGTDGVGVVIEDGRVA